MNKPLKVRRIEVTGELKPTASIAKDVILYDHPRNSA